MKKWIRANTQPNLPLGTDGQRVTVSEAHINQSIEAAKEGMVLLKNNHHTLPLTQGKRIALFGKGTIDYVKGGGGSAEVGVPYIRHIADGFRKIAAERTTAPDLFADSIAYYEKNIKHQYAKGAVPGLTVEPEVPAEMLQKAAAFTDTAVITISRFSGEGWDRKSEFDDDRELAGVETGEMAEMAAKVYPKGDFYLTDEEEKMVEAVTSAFAHVVVVLNVGGVVDTSWFANNDKIDSVLMAWQAGLEGGYAAAQLLCGLGTPSGKLADTFAAKLSDYPSSDTFHESDVYVDYFEDIYVGYRYFETIPGADKKVVYPFGYGLSYTEFSIHHVKVKAENAQIDLTANVTNIGQYPGKEVVQLYYNAPQGLLGKPAKELGAYQKTRLLAPGESQMVHLTFPISQMASYDDLGKVCEAAYVLEKGEYQFYLGRDVRDNSKLAFVYTLEENQVCEQLTHRLVPQGLTKRMLPDGSFEALPVKEGADRIELWEGIRNMAVEQKTVFPRQSAEQMCPPAPAYRSIDGLTVGKEQYPQLSMVAEGKLSLDAFIAQLSDEDLAWLLCGQPNTGVANTFGYGNNVKYGIPNLMTADGPAGVRIFEETGVRTTAFPCATLLACTWDPAVTYTVGVAIAEEVKENNISVWLAPGVCIHRNPLCGRNFEYYSEDPILSAVQAGAVVDGAQSLRIAATVKHFAFNNKETNRRNADARVSERAAREIYLKAFELIVKKNHPWSIMSSYNLVNGQRCSESHELLTDLLRDEWGFDGMVTTDWWGYGEQYLECIAGNDVKMARGWADRLLQAKEAGALTREQMETAVKNVLNLILRVD